jgi:hypothetical protein
MELSKLARYYHGMPFTWLAQEQEAITDVVADFALMGNITNRLPGERLTSLYEPESLTLFVRGRQGGLYPVAECRFESWFVARELAAQNPAYPYVTLLNLKRTPHARYDLYMGRANEHRGLTASMWANPFPLKREADRPAVLAAYEQYVRGTPHLVAALPELTGKRLACWCVHDDPNRAQKVCHVHILLKLHRELVLGMPHLNQGLRMGQVDARLLATPVGQ